MKATKDEVDHTSGTENGEFLLDCRCHSVFLDSRFMFFQLHHRVAGIRVNHYVSDAHGRGTISVIVNLKWLLPRCRLLPDNQKYT